MKRVAFTYTIVRYVHDPISGESLNAAVALLDREGHFEFKVPNTLVRIKRAFPDANLAGVRHSLVALEHAARTFLKKVPNADLEQILDNVLRKDEASFRVSDLGAGVAQKIGEAADSLLERFVTRCDFEFDELEMFSTHTAGWRNRTKLNYTFAASNDDWSETNARRCAR
jgi:hypothetical protein